MSYTTHTRSHINSHTKTLVQNGYSAEIRTRFDDFITVRPTANLHITESFNVLFFSRSHFIFLDYIEEDIIAYFGFDSTI